MAKVRWGSMALAGGVLWLLACTSSDPVEKALGTIGSRCEGDQDCGFASLTCGPEGTCIECVDDGDCAETESCTDGRCRADGTSHSGGEPSAGGSAEAGQGGATPGHVAGGSDGAGGAPIDDCSPNVIDDFEDGNNHICENEGRQGAWGGGDSQWGTLLDPPRGNSLRGAHLHVPEGVISTFSVGFDDWLPYDASQYTGLQLFTRSNAPVDFAVRIQTQSTRSTSEGGNCSESCADNLTGAAASEAWQLQQLRFADIYGGSSALDPSELTGVFLDIGGERDVWVDDVSFY